MATKKEPPNEKSLAAMRALERTLKQKPKRKTLRQLLREEKNKPKTGPGYTGGFRRYPPRGSKEEGLFHRIGPKVGQ